MQRGNQRQWYFYHSIFCPHSRSLRDCINRGKYKGIFQEICIDPPPGTNQRPRLPVFLKQVPTLLVDGNILTGKQAFNFVNDIKPGQDNNSNQPMSSHDGNVGYAGNDSGGNFSFLETNAPGSINMFEKIQPSPNQQQPQQYMQQQQQPYPQQYMQQQPQPYPQQYMQQQPQHMQHLTSSSQLLPNPSSMQQQQQGGYMMGQQPDRMPPMSNQMVPQMQQDQGRNNQVTMDYDRLMQERNQEMQQMKMQPKTI